MTGPIITNYVNLAWHWRLSRLVVIAQRRMNATGKDLMPYGYGLEAKRQKPSAVSQFD